MSKYYDKNGEKMNLLQWAKKFEEIDYKIIKQEELPNKKFVSTVWLGLDHNFGRGKPLIFETMVFNADGSEADMERYSTLKEAKKGHITMINKWRK